MALACFAVAGFSVDRANRAEQAGFLVGASRVLTVSVPGNVDFVRAVRQADPSRKRAMAVEVESSSQGTLLAVDASRFAPVAAWAGQNGAATPEAVARYLAPPVAPEVTVEGASLSATIDLRATLNPRPSLIVGVFNEQYGASGSVTLGPLETGKHLYTTSLEGYCVSVCRLQSVTASWPGAAGAVTIPVTIEQIGDGGSSLVEAGLSDPGSWRVTQDPPGVTSSLLSSARGLVVSLRYVAWQAPPVIDPADVPTVLPAVVYQRCRIGAGKSGRPAPRTTRCSTSMAARFRSTAPCRSAPSLRSATTP